MELNFNKEKFSININVKDNILKSIINDVENEFYFRKISYNQLSLFIDNKYRNVYIAEDDNHFYVAYDGDNFIFEKINQEELDFEKDNSNDGNIDKLIPPMPGSIVKVLVENGQKVKEGDPIIILEAMKMETTLYSSIDGIVTEINVKAGQQVDSNQILVVINKEAK